MPRYNPEMKSAILRAAIVARAARKKWADALQDAKEVGYEGSVQSLVKMIRAGNNKKRPRRTVVASAPEGPAGPFAAPRRKSGRPKGSKNAVKRAPERVISVAVNDADLAGIEAIVERMVEQRVGAAVAKAVKALGAAKYELRNL